MKNILISSSALIMLFATGTMLGANAINQQITEIHNEKAQVYCQAGLSSACQQATHNK